MSIHSAPLAELAADLRSGKIELTPYLNEICDRIDTNEAQVHALLPEPDRRARLLRAAAELQARYPNPAQRPRLYGVPVGVKDIFHVDGFPTRAGSSIPPEVLTGPEAASVTTLRQAGALILGKTVTTEFAYFEPGPTANPHNVAHTPGGSSSGSAVAVALGYWPLALGSQTIGSTIRPAAFVGIVGFKPTYGRIDISGVIPLAPSLDHVGLFTQDVEGMNLAASLLCRDWHWVHDAYRPRLGVPDGPYLGQATNEAFDAFQQQVGYLQRIGYTVRHVPVLEDIDQINSYSNTLMAAEMAEVHAKWFSEYQRLYRPRTVSYIVHGRSLSPNDVIEARTCRSRLRVELAAKMMEAKIDLWVCPAATGPAPHGLDSTGNPAMNLPWTFAGMPTVTVPAGKRVNGLPLGFQCVAGATADEFLLAWVGPIAKALAQ